jgi:hypothetical protein
LDEIEQALYFAQQSVHSTRRAMAEASADMEILVEKMKALKKIMMS